MQYLDIRYSQLKNRDQIHCLVKDLYCSFNDDLQHVTVEYENLDIQSLYSLCRLLVSKITPARLGFIDGQHRIVALVLTACNVGFTNLEYPDYLGKVMPESEAFFELNGWTHQLVLYRPSGTEGILEKAFLEQMRHESTGTQIVQTQYTTDKPSKV